MTICVWQVRKGGANNWLKLVEQCEYYTAAEFEHVVNEAARLALSGSCPITEEHILKALYDNLPSLDSEKVKKAISPIGFLSYKRLYERIDNWQCLEYPVHIEWEGDTIIIGFSDDMPEVFSEYIRLGWK